MKHYWVIPLVFLLLVGALAHVAAGRAATTTGRGRIMRVSVASDGAQANGDVSRSGFAADGRTVAFVSDATNLTAEPIIAGHSYLYTYDRATHQTTFAPLTPPGTPVDLATLGHDLAVSGDGRFIAFDTFTAIAAGDSNGRSDIYVHDRQTGQTTRVSVATGGAQNNADSLAPRLSYDGRFVVFASEGDVLVPGYSGAGTFIHDRQTGVTTAVTVATDGSPANMGGGGASISDDGRLVAFLSVSTNLGDEAIPGKTNIFLHDRQTGETSWVWSPPEYVHINFMDMSGDGRYLAIGTESGCYYDICDDVIHLYDRLAGQVIGHLDNAYAGSGSYQIIATAGPVVAVLSDAPLVAADTDNFADVYRHDFATGVTTLVTDPEFGPSVWFDTPSHVAISADGRDIVFRSEGPSFVPGDTNESSDLFLWTAKAYLSFIPIIR